jgi:hypothetical protein
MQRLCSPAMNALTPLGLKARGGCVQRPHGLCVHITRAAVTRCRFAARALWSRVAFVGEDAKLSRARRGVARAADASAGRTASTIQARVAQDASGDAIRRRFLVRACGPLRCCRARSQGCGSRRCRTFSRREATPSCQARRSCLKTPPCCSPSRACCSSSPSSWGRRVSHAQATRRQPLTLSAPRADAAACDSEGHDNAEVRAHKRH